MWGVFKVYLGRIQVLRSKFSFSLLRLPSSSLLLSSLRGLGFKVEGSDMST